MAGCTAIFNQIIIECASRIIEVRNFDLDSSGSITTPILVRNHSDSW